MEKRHLRGQEATEFVLISVLVFLGALLVVFLFGNKISSFFTSESSVAKSAKIQVANAGNNNQQYNNNIDSYTGPTKQPSVVKSIGGQETTVNSDGSYSFTTQGQTVTITPDMANLANSVFETTGSSGVQDLIKEVAAMIASAKADYPNSSVPIEVAFGSGKRFTNITTYEGDANALANSFTIKSGNSMVIIQKDQTCSKQSSETVTGCSFTGQYRIEGSIDASNNFTGKVQSAGVIDNPYGTFSSKVTMSNGLAFSNSKYIQTDDYNDSTTTYNWDLTFGNDKSFKI